MNPDPAVLSEPLRNKKSTYKDLYKSTSCSGSMIFSWPDPDPIQTPLSRKFCIYFMMMKILLLS